MDNTFVKPSTDTGRIEIATDDVDDVHYPVYKLALGKDGKFDRFLSYEQPLPIEYKDLLEVNKEILIQLKIMNSHFAEWDGEEDYGDD